MGCAILNAGSGALRRELRYALAGMSWLLGWVTAMSRWVTGLLGVTDWRDQVRSHVHPGKLKQAKLSFKPALYKQVKLYTIWCNTCLLVDYTKFLYEVFLFEVFCLLNIKCRTVISFLHEIESNRIKGCLWNYTRWAKLQWWFFDWRLAHESSYSYFLFDAGFVGPYLLSM